MTPHIRRATPADLAVVAPLFDGYRRFYGRPSDMALAETFLCERIIGNESVIFLAVDADGDVAGTGTGVGFVQLYPSFSSVAARRIWILNDLYVIADARKHGIGRALLDAAAEHGRSTGAARLVLSTATDNRPAQALYESYGFQRDDQFFTYQFELTT